MSASKSTLFKAVSTGAGIAAAAASRQIILAVWPNRDSPPNPADRRISWGEALRWAVVASVGAGIARLVARRGAAAGWERALGETPPGLRTA